MPDSEWIVGPAEAGLRLDKYLADPERLGSRAKAFAGLERGKVFLDGDEAGAADAATRLTAGQTVRVWMDRPGTAKARRPVTRVGDLRAPLDRASDEHRRRVPRLEQPGVKAERGAGRASLVVRRVDVDDPHFLNRGASPLGLPHTRSRAPLLRRAPFAWLVRCRSLARLRRGRFCG